MFEGNFPDAHVLGGLLVFMVVVLKFLIYGF
jgi:hypothetical protein